MKTLVPDYPGLAERATEVMRRQLSASEWERAIGGVKQLASRLAHPFRRSAALRQLRTMEPVRSVVFICHGNLYRSPFAERLFVRLLPEAVARKLSVDSAGFAGAGRPTPEAAVALAASRGVELGSHRSAVIQPDTFDDSTLVVVMEARQAEALRSSNRRSEIMVLGDLDPMPVRSRNIEDPWSESDIVLRRCYDRVERCVGVLVREVVTLHTGREAGAGAGSAPPGGEARP